MEFGYFAMPSHPPERGIKQAFRWDLQVIRWLDELGYSEAWIGEHHTVPWEPMPAPDLLIAQALLQTSRIRLGPGGFLLPFHHPAELANRVALLDQISGGRLNLGISASSIPTDQVMFNIDGRSGEHRAMARESLDIMLRLWGANEPFDHEGKYWKVSYPAPMFDGLFRPHLRPLQQPHPPIGITALTPASKSLGLAGERGYMPMSLSLGLEYLASHWAAYAEGAAIGRRVPSRKDWRILREVFVAETDQEAWRLSACDMMGRMTREHSLPFIKLLGALDMFKHTPEVPDSDVTPDYVARHHWIVGSPATVAAKIEAMHRNLGGFGTLLVMGFDYADKPDAWYRSLQLLANEVAPRLKHLKEGSP
jgi:alkanesulfonate monooxygenase SsuD/methylene tetrahydromethanopterin reductase-like flavin-dependent oxidoreductase (luciferase family)